MFFFTFREVQLKWVQLCYHCTLTNHPLICLCACIAYHSVSVSPSTAAPPDTERRVSFADIPADRVKDRSLSIPFVTLSLLSEFQSLVSSL